MSQDNVAARLASHMEPDQGKEQQQSELEQINCQRGLIWASRHRYYYWSVAFLSWYQWWFVWLSTFLNNTTLIVCVSRWCMLWCVRCGEIAEVEWSLASEEAGHHHHQLQWWADQCWWDTSGADTDQGEEWHQSSGSITPGDVWSGQQEQRQQWEGQ